MRVCIRRFHDLSPPGPEGRSRVPRRFRSQIPFGLHPIRPWQAQQKLIGWRMTATSFADDCPRSTVLAFIRCRTNMPSADFCCEIKTPRGAFSHDSATHSRSPEVSSTAFPTQPPNLQRASLMDMGLAVISPLARRRMPQIRFLYIGSWYDFTSIRLSRGLSPPELSNMLGTPRKEPCEVIAWLGSSFTCRGRPRPLGLISLES